MCIRDSLYALNLSRDVISRNKEKYLIVVEGYTDVIVCHQSCLLYTSDAADERSSVDLGGRRIINKKSHVHNTPRHQN